MENGKGRRTATRHTTQRVRLATYNFHMGGWGEHWRRALAATQADLLFVQEARDPRLVSIDARDPTSLASNGLEPEELAQIHWQSAPRRRWGSGLFVRGGEIRPVAVPGFAGWVVGGSVRLGGAGGVELHAFSVHVPSTKGRSYVAEGRRLLRALRRMKLPAPDVPLVLGGDFNLAMGRRPPGDPIPTSAGERDWLDRFERGLGLVSAWQACHPEAPLAQTLRWRRNAEAAYHCDGLFVPEAWRERLISATVHSGDPWVRLSDHNPVEVEIAT